ncbi:hypothetical protein AXG93_2572s1010 [Marchantia polymorpha subsp. ruderalis]|uniref:Uncharacterized protein n=1 Tax=Marchantia polymorpha subsp. ruderalis TaxID=1480154 RepID=A0A176WEE9_MARPO|nr:hypothetical protein AXG93_2572s1010 [Marchantia polymorpha subsp. ruderalis]
MEATMESDSDEKALSSKPAELTSDSLRKSLPADVLLHVLHNLPLQEPEEGMELSVSTTPALVAGCRLEFGEDDDMSWPHQVGPAGRLANRPLNDYWQMEIPTFIVYNPWTRQFHRLPSSLASGTRSLYIPEVNILCIYNVKLDAWIQLRQPASEDIIWRCMEHKGEVLLGLDNRNGSSGNELCFYETVEYMPENVRPWHFDGDSYFREKKAVPMPSVVDVLAPLYEDSTSRTTNARFFILNISAKWWYTGVISRMDPSTRSHTRRPLLLLTLGANKNPPPGTLWTNKHPRSDHDDGEGGALMDAASPTYNGPISRSRYVLYSAEARLGRISVLDNISQSGHQSKP